MIDKVVWKMGSINGELARRNHFSPAARVKSRKSSEGRAAKLKNEVSTEESTYVELLTEPGEGRQKHSLLSTGDN